MKIDILDFIQNYNLFYSITNDPYEAIGMYLSTVGFIFLISFAINGITVGKLPAFKGKKALMGTTLAILVATIGEGFYSFLECFKTPLAWIDEHMWLLLLLLICLCVLIIFGALAIVVINDKIKNKKKRNE